jgi:hypothetical protein
MGETRTLSGKLMTHWRRIALLVAVTGCMPYGRPTVRPGSNIATEKKPSVVDAVAATLLCGQGVQDTSRVGQQPCVKASKPDAAQPAPLPAKKP